MDWRVALGLSITVLWFTAGLTYLLGIVGAENFIHLATADIGSFLEGAFAPLAFLWLVIGHFMQQKEIGANTRAIKLQEQSARRLELHSQQDSYFKLLTLVQQQLGSIAGFHYMSVCGPTGTGEISSVEFTEQRAISTTGDHAWFIRKMISLCLGKLDNKEAMHEIFFSTPVRARHTENFAKTFKKLLNAGQAVDTDDMVTDALLNGSAEGLYYRIILNAKGEVPLEMVPAPQETPPTNIQIAVNADEDTRPV
tara:strand:- start:5931 stop:6689 length:759 start_codon:yes stop_codon:yes gene_type:complete